MEKRPHRNSIPCANALEFQQMNFANDYFGFSGSLAGVSALCCSFLATEMLTDPIWIGACILSNCLLPSISGPEGTKVSCGFSSFERKATSRALFMGNVKCAGLNSPWV